MASSPLWLFVSNVFAHHFSWIGLLLTVIGVVEKISEKTIVIPSKWVVRVGVAFLFISCYQAWLDEHHNLQVVIREKAILSGANLLLNQKLQDDQQNKQRIEAIRKGLGDLIAKGMKIRDKAPANRIDMPPDVIADWHKWTAEADRFLRKNLDVADAVTFKSYETQEGVPLQYIIRNEIGDLEELLKQLGH